MDDVRDTPRWTLPGECRDMRAVTFAAWRAGHYVPLAELLVRLGGFVFEFMWRVEIDEYLPGRGCLDLRDLPPSGEPVDTLRLLALTAPDVQIVDGVFTGYRHGEPVLVIDAFDSSSWEVYSADDSLLADVLRIYPDAREMPPEWRLPTADDIG